MHNPPHPGELLSEDVIEGLSLSVTEAARRLGTTRTNLSRVMHCHTGISADLADRLERAGIGTARHWLAMQSAYDLWKVRSRPAAPVLPLQTRV
ncbi:addiction module antidote protein, HigA family [Kushneria avicenniae]|uniref:Addiction module antidote protein, HigA family n=1 Tax=Kushneria avicenniae TaxID=402385 RepID=A0A1I1MLQ4_9GAMM|nr:HigA family addiction module antitoxin [Kushneria avicenniae]SFC86377.1 addiction module antidote protein, HigA family [Kushneria avicenniae]